MRAGTEAVPVLLFGGTAEGHRLAEYLAGREQPVILCVATEYGREVLGSALEGSPWLDIRVGRLDADQMKELIRKERPGLAIDATHPYAAQVTENLRAACRETGTERLRCLRPSGADEDVRLPRPPGADEDVRLPRPSGADGDGRLLRFPDGKSAAAYLAGTEGGILMTIGSKELPVYASIPDFADRVYARVLPVVEALEICLGLGLKGRHIIAMQGPFSRETNVSQLREFHCGCLVTKDTGYAGGCREKIDAAAQTGAVALVIERPESGIGMTADQVICRYEQWRKSDVG